MNPSSAPLASAKPSFGTRFIEHPLQREFVALVLLFIAFIVGSLLSNKFLDLGYQLDATSLWIETGFIALALTFIIVSGQIDLSVASTLALVAGVTGILGTRGGLPFGVACICGLGLGALLGAFNGVLVAYTKLPSLSVTLGTFALYRGLAQVLFGDQSVTGFPDWFTGIDTRHLGPTPIPLTLVLFAIAAVGFGFVLHRTILGRWTVSIGLNEAASRYSGIAVPRIQVLLFTMSGLVAGFAGLLMSSRLTVARYDMGLGLELDAITAVVLGGTSIFGGRGTILGTVIAMFLIGVLRTGMGLANIKVENQLVVIGGLLLFSVLVPNLLGRGRFSRT
ncbi:autoinducer 2 import system permease protein LsrD [Abditibacteriota bacterium]|nr:autoinducer 2 import system permease protein LsrD [Abditibacteriota bacterium]